MRKAFIRPKKVKEMRKQEQLNKQSERKLKERTENVKVYPNLQDNVTFVGKTLGDSGDLITRKFKIPYNPTREAAIMYFDGMADSAIVDEFILHSLTVEPEKVDEKYNIVQWLEDRLLHIGETKRSRNMEDMLAALLYGDTILYVDGCEEGFILGTKGWKHRGVEEPNIEAVVRGSREGLTENIRVNSALIRRRLKDPDLRLISYTLGKRTKTSVAVLYIEGIMDEKTLDEIKKRIEGISIDGVLESGYIEEFIEDNTWSPFPQVQGTERPDACVAHLLEGKAVILVDGTPFSLIVPAVFSQFYCSPEDYYSRFLISSLVRCIRFISFFIALLLPALYIAFVSFHTEMIPSKLSIAIAAGRSTVPFPSVIEALLMEISVEILREASIRLPGPIGPTIGIVGALVIGESAVAAGIVSPLMVIVVALTTIGSYANPSYTAAIAIRILRFPLMIAAATVGLYGVMLGLILIVLHLVKLKSFGVPYLSPITPFKLRDAKDSLLRMPWKWMNERPQTFSPGDNKREGQIKPQKSGGPS